MMGEHGDSNDGDLVFIPDEEMEMDEACTEVGHRSKNRDGLIPRREPTRVVLTREDGTMFTPFTPEIAKQIALQTGTMSGEEIREHEQAMDDIGRAITKMEFTISTDVVDEDGMVTVEQRTADLGKKEDLESLESQHHYSIYKFKEDDVTTEAEDISGKLSSIDLIEFFDPGDMIQFSAEQIGLYPIIESDESEMVEEDKGKEILEKFEDMEQHPLGELKRTRHFPLDSNELGKIHHTNSDAFDVFNRVPSLLLSIPVKSPFITSLLIDRPFPVVDNSSNLIRMYGAAHALLEMGAAYDVDYECLSRRNFKKTYDLYRARRLRISEIENMLKTKGRLTSELSEEYDRLKTRQTFLHFSHYSPKEKTEVSRWEIFPDPFAEDPFTSNEAFTPAIGTENALKLFEVTFDLWFSKVPEEWMTMILPSANIARQIMKHWFMREWCLKLVPDSMPSFEHLKPNFVNAQKLATRMTIFYLGKLELRKRLMCWIYYEMEFGLLRTEMELFELCFHLQQVIADRGASPEEPWKSLGLEDERDLWKYVYNQMIFPSVRDTLVNMELYLLRRSFEGPDIDMNRWGFLCSSDLNLAVQDETFPVSDKQKTYHPFSNYVTDVSKTTFTWYRDILLRGILREAPVVGDEGPSDSSSRLQNLVKDTISNFVCIQSTTIDSSNGPVDLKWSTFNYDAFHSFENDNEKVFPDLEWSPTMFVMRQYWSFIIWSTQVDDKSLDDKLTNTVFEIYDFIPTLQMMSKSVKDYPKIKEKVEALCEKLGHSKTTKRTGKTNTPVYQEKKRQSRE
jgi:hypothetical protein